MAVTTMAVSALSINANAYWTTKKIYDSRNKEVGEGYLAVATTSVYATTTRNLTKYPMAVFINYANGNHDPSRDNGGLIDGQTKFFIQWWGTNFTDAESYHEVNGRSITIHMGSES